ncbi:hypothetical protein [Legionella fallonii]|uniref:Uncharacterized protein n=1 Tax=Legionella fallonii LLAP-10 TaxID=1212491 RepID=A0A098FZP5_9GAMM|nr:hypothetical protein [Legionella fallonii]CEG55707.1 protein of unknown function [Legionella fallonii LLAP-10]
MDIRCIDNSDKYLDTLSNYFRLFYEKEPWGDYQGCDNCYASLLVSEAPRFGQDEKICKNCGKPLGPFWSVSRCKSAVEETNLAVGYFENDELKGWIIAKPVSETILAINFMGLDSKFRRNKSKIILMKEALYTLSLMHIMKRLRYLNQWAYNRLLKIPIVSLQLYCFFENQAKKMGYTTIQSTTHKNARNIFNALRSVGFHLDSKNLPNDRVLFTKKLY